jgi:hypothetical protein
MKETNCKECDPSLNRIMKDNECACIDGYYFDGINKECQCKKNILINLNIKKLKLKIFSFFFCTQRMRC